MICEIEFLAVGDASKAGDAIVVRYGSEQDYRLMLIDGGHAETGERIVKHLKHWFGPTPALADVLLTHSDADHASGLRTVLEQVPVRNVWLHVPWLFAEPALFLDPRWTEDGLRDRIRAEYNIVAEIVDLASARGCNIYQPFQGHRVGPFTVLSPPYNAYRYLVPQFDRTPDPDQTAIEAARMWIGKESLAARLATLARTATQVWTDETWEQERLRNGGVTSASNESSVVLYGSFDNNQRVLLTGDAGVNGLTWAASHADRTGLQLQQFSLVQVPHHGSRRNVGPAILDRLLGPPQPRNSPVRFSAVISCPKSEEQHPRRIVQNAFKRRGGWICKTQGFDMRHPGGFGPRLGYGNSPEVPFYTKVEEYI